MIDINFRFFNKHFKFEYIYSKRILPKFLPNFLIKGIQDMLAKFLAKLLARTT